jgi:hypothetical protein
MKLFFPTFSRYLYWSVEFLYTPPFCYVTLAIFASLVISVLVQRPHMNPIWKKYYSIPIVQFLCFPAAIAVAAVGYVDWQPPNYHGPNTWGLRTEDLLGVISLCLGIYWIWKMKGLRWLAISVTLLQLWILAGANFIAGMALTGQWL